MKQIRQLGDFYLRAQFEGGPVDYRKYRTLIKLDGGKTGSTLQETDTISRLIFGLASAYMLTGDDRYLEGADKGTRYLHDHLRVDDRQREVVYWYHALDVAADGNPQNDKKHLGSLFGDDYGAMPCYEQIYALAGPTQTYRITGDPQILRDIEGTVRLFWKYYHDDQKKGFFSHLEPETLDPRSEKLNQNRARKNWNSVGDHAPAFLINLWLATGKQEYADFLEYTFDTIAEHFPDYQSSPFVQEKFFEDWSHDEKWGWQQNRGVMGHNLKIAWNIMRMQSLKPKDSYVSFARKIAEVMPQWGMDKTRGGWYDVLERRRGEGEEFHRYVWHDRKAWWQQEQGILAYYILAGCLGGDDYRRLAQDSAAFYNAWFLDHDDGAVYFNTLANGLPYLLGTERFKGSHSMSGYHSFELAYLCSVYSNLLVTKQPMDFYFKPQPNGFADKTLRVSPDILPQGSVRIDSVTADGQRYDRFDAQNLTVAVPDSAQPVQIKVRIAPTR